MEAQKSKSQRSMTGNHRLLPASRPTSAYKPNAHIIPTYSLLTWSLGRGSVIWRIWPAVVLYTFFASVIVYVSLRGIISLQIPSVMLTVLGVVIGFVISYRASSGYERYWLGRTCWSDVMRNSRTLGRLIWFHVPPRLTAKTPEETKTGHLLRSTHELNKVMSEKRMALDLIEGFAVALKHHIRGELGIYYEDLYHLIRPMHEHTHSADDRHTQRVLSADAPSPRRAQRITTQTLIQETSVALPETSSQPHVLVDVTAEPDYGTFDPSKLSSEANPAGEGSSKERIPRTLRHSSSNSSQRSAVSAQSEHQPLMPSSQPPPEAENIMGKVSRDMIPFAGTISLIRRGFQGSRSTDEQSPSNHPEIEAGDGPSQPGVPEGRKWQGPIYSGLHAKHRPKVAGGGENLPLEILRCLSEWFSTLEDRGTVPGSSLGPMIAAIAAFEENLTALERILTTPLPFSHQVRVFDVSYQPVHSIIDFALPHPRALRHTVWVYLFFLPFQLVGQFGYYTIPGVAIASFIYLGFVAAGEEIEQPFGYDENDLDLDLFCQSIIHADIKQLKNSPCLNAYFDPEPEHKRSDNVLPVPRRSLTLSEAISSDRVPL
ncbi:hypothetical protein D9619_002547 [Psilocybe cf. subviscida]|uniref:Uncharacterized protein n=1 Tax=Psilocybe cf. subviscida TaxID=2480587 RepID=A0A8H5EU06_9AGAR|nr:hypothetical protein D9619_002547 [Psilocybe cf. subviscida]